MDVKILQKDSSPKLYEMPIPVEILAFKKRSQELAKIEMKSKDLFPVAYTTH